MSELNTLDPPPTQSSHEEPGVERVVNVPWVDGAGTSGEPPLASHAENMDGSKSRVDQAEPLVENAVDTPDNPEDALAKGGEQNSNELLGKLPPEIGMLLVISGVAGILLPGLVGTPLLIAGGVSIWPKTFEPIERWFSRRFPSVHKEGVIQIKEFISDLNKRFPNESQ